LHFWFRIDNPKRHVLGAPQLEVAGAFVALDFCKEIFHFNHEPGLLRVIRWQFSF
jgi:hypothetical protein